MLARLCTCIKKLMKSSDKLLIIFFRKRRSWECDCAYLVCSRTIDTNNQNTDGCLPLVEHATNGQKDYREEHFFPVLVVHVHEIGQNSY